MEENMKYYLVIVQNDSAQAVYAYIDLDDALAAFHQELAYRASDRLSTLCVIMNSHGNFIKQDYYQKPNEE